MAKRLLLVMSARTYRANAFLEAAGKAGVIATVASDLPQALAGFNPAGHLLLDFSDLDASVARVAEFARRYPIQAVVPAEDDGVPFAARAGRALGLAHNPPEAADATRNKHLLRRALARAGLPSPPFELWTRDEDPEVREPAFGYPCVLKPLGLSGSQGVIRADDRVEFAAAFRRIRALLENHELAAMAPDGGRHLLVEGYIPGIEVAVEAILTQGSGKALAIFDKPDPLEGPVFEETIYVTPSRLAEGERARCLEMGFRATAALGLRHGPVHVELRLHEGEWYVVDVAARSIGGLCSQSLRFDGGMSLEEVILRHALGEDISEIEREGLASGVMMIPAPQAGILRERRGLEAAAATPGVEAVQLTLPVGQRVERLPEAARYLGFIFARAPTPEAVEAALRAAHARLEFRIEPA